MIERQWRSSVTALEKFHAAIVTTFCRHFGKAKIRSRCRSEHHSQTLQAFQIRDRLLNCGR
jgi:hypothetical protein